MTERPSLDEYFLEIAFVVGKRATCLRNNVGAVIVRDKRILSTGYNGAPSGMEHCLEIGCIRDMENIPSGTRHEKCRAVHAEQNAIIQAAISPVFFALRCLSTRTSKELYMQLSILTPIHLSFSGTQVWKWNIYLLH
jgi:dCMP deaminase